MSVRGRTGSGNQSVIEVYLVVVRFWHFLSESYVSARFPQEICRMDDVQVSDEMVEWLKERIEHCGNATMSEFAEMFKYSHREDADRTFSVLISKSFLRKSTRHTLQSSYEVWKRNEGDQFWAALEATTRVATDLVVGSVPKARNIVLGDNRHTRAKRSTQAIPTASSGGISNEYPASTPERALKDCVQVGQKHPRDPFENESIDLPKTPRNRSSSPTIVTTESIDSPPTVTFDPPEKNPFVVDEDEEDYLLPESASEEFLFKGMFEDINVAAGFQSYFSKVKASRVYIKHTDQALGRSGIVLIKDVGTELQNMHFGSDTLAKLRLLFHKRFWKTADVTTERSQVRGWLDAIEDRKFDRAESFTEIISSCPSSSLARKLCTYVLSALNDFPLVNDKSYSESTGISCYIAPLCRVFMASTEKLTFFNFVDKKTVSSQTTSSRKEPDMVLELKDASNRTICDLAFGEATSHSQQNQHKKNAKDLVRLGLNLKDSLDSIEDRYDVRDAVLTGVQVVADTMSIYLMARCGNMYLMVHEQDYVVPDSLKSLLLMNSQYKAFHELALTIDDGIAPILQAMGRTGGIVQNPAVRMLRCATTRTPEFKTFLMKG
ncbi:hypothetical protein BGX28_009107 [Mortierella sp. GBA30]|nr:hypothetical protein BGX28_009107 [Mortierella sp. GBA30]